MTERGANGRTELPDELFCKPHSVGRHGEFSRESKARGGTSARSHVAKSGTRSGVER